MRLPQLSLIKDDLFLVGCAALSVPIWVWFLTWPGRISFA